jgi:hypothetical protein
MAKKAIQTAPSINTEKRNLSGILVAAAIAIGIIGLGLLIWLNVREPPPIRGVVIHSRPSRGHDNSVQYPAANLPPVGGTHFDQWQNCGIYTEEINEENAIHSMEHGAVWITYSPNMNADNLATLQDKVRGDSYILLSSYPSQSSPIVLTVWGIQLEVDSVSDRRIDQFIERYRTGPQTPERGSACSGGVGDPQ